MKRRKTAPRVRIPFLWAAVVIGVVPPQCGPGRG